MIFLFLLVSFSVYAGDSAARKVDGHEMSRSRLRLEQTVIDVEDLKAQTRRHETHSTLEIGDDEESLSELALQLYFGAEESPLRNHIRNALQKKIAYAKENGDARSKTSFDALRILLEDQKKSNADLKGSVDKAKNNEEISSFVHSLVVQTLEDAFAEKDSNLSKKSSQIASLTFQTQQQARKTKLVAYGHILTGILSSGITAAIVVASLLTQK